MSLATILDALSLVTHSVSLLSPPVWQRPPRCCPRFGVVCHFPNPHHPPSRLHPRHLLTQSTHTATEASAVLHQVPTAVPPPHSHRVPNHPPHTSTIQLRTPPSTETPVVAPTPPPSPWIAFPSPRYSLCPLVLPKTRPGSRNAKSKTTATELLASIKQQHLAEAQGAGAAGAPLSRSRGRWAATQ